MHPAGAQDMVMDQIINIYIHYKSFVNSLRGKVVFYLKFIIFHQQEVFMFRSFSNKDVFKGFLTSSTLDYQY